MSTCHNINTYNTLNRRDFMSLFSMVGAAAFLPLGLITCTDEKTFTGTGKVPFKVWEEMLQAMKTSSDYLPGRVEQLITSKDPEAMYNFVKNEIVLVPTNRLNLSGLGTSVKRKISEILRCGVSNPREKAELLNFMYNKAGIDSKVVFEYTDIKPDEVSSFFFRPLVRSFNPIISNKQFELWEKEMGVSTSFKKNKIRHDYIPEAKDLADKLLKNITSYEKYTRVFDMRWDNYRTPTIEFIDKGETKYAHLFDPKIKFGSLRNNGAIKPANPVKENKEIISVRISYRNAIDPLKEKELISGEWNAKDIVGKQVLLNFLNGLSLEEQVVTSIGDVRTFTPSLSLQAVDESVDYMSERSYLGDTLTIDGRILQIDKTGSLNIDGNKLIAKVNPNLQKTVSNLSIQAIPGSYPVVKLNIVAKDQEGNLIEGLSANDFLITEDNQPVMAMMENNQRTPKILVLSDASFSMPKQYYKEGMEKFNKQLKKNILKKYPSAVIDFWKTPSELFTWLLKASQTNADLIIYATDGDNKDAFNEKDIELYKAGPPALVLNVINRKSKNYLDTFKKMAEITNGAVINAKDQIKTLDEISRRIDAIDIPPYVFSYASSNNDTEHKVKVSIDNKRLSSKSIYKFPKKVKRNQNGIVGIYLELKVGKNNPIKRVLAGWDIKNYKFDSNKKYALEVEGLLFGNLLIAVEGEGPTLSMAISDLLKTYLSNRNWGEAYLDNNIKKAKEELSKGMMYMPSELIPMILPLQELTTKESLTFTSGYRISMVKTIIGIEQPTFVTFDFLPTSQFVTMAKDKKRTFDITILKTAQLALRENSLFDQSTYSLLKNNEWINLKRAINEKWLGKIIDYKHSDYQFWRESVFRGDRSYKIYDKNANTKAFWRIDYYTGEMYGIMPDGSGGGFHRFDDQLEQLNKVIDMYTKIFDKMGLMNMPLGIVAIYGKTLVKLYAIVSEVIIVMDSAGMDDAIKQALKEMACEIAKKIVSDLSSEAGKIMEGLDKIVALISGEKNAFSCPS